MKVSGGRSLALGVRVWLAAAMVLVAAALGWGTLEVRRLRTEMSRLQSERAEREPPAVLFVLTPGPTRDGSALKKLVIPPGSPVRLQLDLESRGRYDGFRVSVATFEGGEVWSQDLGPGAPPVVELPADVLAARDYLARVPSRVGGGAYQDLGSFPVRIVR